MADEPTYLPESEYEALVAEVIANFEPVDLRERAVLSLCAAGIWPESVRPAEEM